MDIYKLKFTKLQNEIIRALCIKAGSSINQRRLAKLLKVSPTAVAKSLKLLEENDIVKVEKQEMNLNLVSLNRDNAKSFHIKRIENLKLIYETGLVEFLEEELPGNAIILFGSFSRGDDTLSSDIDIAVIGSKKQINLERFEKVLERKISIHSCKSLKEMGTELKENILNGIVLVGGVNL